MTQIKGLPLDLNDCPEMVFPTQASIKTMLVTSRANCNNGEPREPKVLHISRKFYKKYKDILGLEPYKEQK